MHNPMTGRERARLALSHREPDCVPLDIGGTHDSTCLTGSYENLCRYFGITGSPRIANRWLGSIWLDDILLEKLDVDFHYLAMPAPDYPEKTFPDGSRVFQDEWGLLWKKPAGGFYFDVFQFLDIESLTDVEQKIKVPPSPLSNEAWVEQLNALKKEALRLAQETDYAVVLDLGVIPFTMAQLFLGFEESSVKMIENPAVVEAIMDKVLDHFTQVAEPLLTAVGDHIDAIYGFADDLGTQQSIWISPKMYRDIIKPYHAKIVECIKKFTKAKIIYHSCGNTFPFIPDLIEVGIDVLSPVQVSACGMDTARLKKDFGDVLSFWGAIDTQHVLPFGSEQEVIDEVRKRIDHLAPGGGFVLGPVHNIQPDVPAHNIATMARACRQYGQYPNQRR